MRHVVVMLVLAIPAAAAANPNFTIGSNHFETIQAFPHDLLQWPEQGVFMTISPQSLPWQGDVTNISNRPSDSYTSNYQELEFAPPYDYTGDPGDVRSWLKMSAYARKLRTVLGGLTTRPRQGKFLVELSNTSINMDLEARGVARATEGEGSAAAYPLIPFQAASEVDRAERELKVLWARELFGYPVGVRASYMSKSASEPHGFLRFTRDGTTYQSPHLTWGWATVGCNHIFGYSHINADAWFQNSYTVFSGYQTDIQLSTEFNGNYKTGLRYRSTQEDGDNYTWEYAAGSDYLGAYHRDERWRDHRSSRLIRGYSKVKFWKHGDADAGVLFFLQRGTHAETEENRLVAGEPNSREGAGEWTIETNPFMNYEFHGGHFDFGLLCELSRTGYENTETRWNGVSGSDQEDVLWSTTAYDGWSPSWESFSRGNEKFFATGFEADTAVPVHRRTAALLRLTVLRKFSWITKDYGQSEIPTGSNSYEFRETHERNNYKNETWMTGMIGLSYGRGPVQAFLTMQLPIAYLVKQKTKLSAGDQVQFEHEMRNVWQVQEPTTLRLTFVRALGS